MVDNIDLIYTLLTLRLYQLPRLLLVSTESYLGPYAVTFIIIMSLNEQPDLRQVTAYF